MSKSIFVSHAVKDKDLVKEIVSLIEDGMGVPEDEIFCSSLDGYGIPTGENFVTHIKSQLIKPKIVVLVLTPAYFESKFCISELGAAWIMSHTRFPILVPPLQYSDVKDVILGVQVAKVDDDIKYNELLGSIRSSIALTAKSQTKWDLKRRAFLKSLDPILKNILPPTLISYDKYQATIEQLEEAKAELDASEEEIRALKERLTATEALKDKTEVAALSAEFDKSEITEKFNKMIGEIKKCKSVIRGKEVFKFILSKYYGKPYKIDWYYDRSEFENAVRYGFIDTDDDGRALWSKQKMKNLHTLLKTIDQFVVENAEYLRSVEDIPLETGDQDFWEHHYEI